MGKVLTIFKGHKGDTCFLLCVGVISSAVSSIGLPLVIKNIIDEGIMGGSLEALGYFSLLAFLIVLVAELASYAIKLIQSRLQNSIVLELNVRMLDRFYKIPYDHIIKNDRGYFVSRIYDEISKTIAPLVSLVTETFVAILSVLAAVGVLFYVSWRLTILLGLSVPIFFIIINKTSSRIRQASNQASEYEARSKGVLERLIGAYKVVNVFGLYDRAKLQYGALLRRQLEASYSNVKISNAFSSLSGGVAFSTQITLLLVSGYEIIQGRLTYGSALAVSNIYALLLSNADVIFRSVPNIQQALATLDRVNEFNALADARKPCAGSDGIALKAVGLAYDGRSVFENLDLTIKRGERVLITGSNGSGKTTLAHVITGFLPPTAGEARVPGVARISASFFPPSFIPGDVKENVNIEESLGSKRRLFSELAKEFGMDDKLQEDPDELSAGQRQKASLIMALLKDADVYIFDEPLANIDIHTKGKVLEKILTLGRDKTLIVMMHCDEDVYHLFDRVIDLDLKRGDEAAYAEPQFFPANVAAPL
jgi:ABC-type bacteriocin/lantibiotic exporter with double-glycine peptidase domain